MNPHIENRIEIKVSVNGSPVERIVSSRLLLIDFIRDDLALFATHIGCGEGACGACTILLDGVPARSCTMLAVQAHGSAIQTVEGLDQTEGLTQAQAVFKEHHALQCGYCTPGILATVSWMIEEKVDPSDEMINEHLAGHLCRCTGYRNIITAVRALLSEADIASERHKS